MRANDAVRFLQRTPQANTAMVARHLGVREDTAEALLRMLHDEGKVKCTSLRGRYGWWAAVHRPDHHDW